MAGRDVQGLEVAPIPPHPPPSHRLESERPEDPRHLAHRLADRMQAPDADPPRRKRHVLALRAEIPFNRLRAERRAALLQCRLDAVLGRVQRGPICRLLRWLQLRDAFHGLAELAFSPEILHPGSLERGRIGRHRYLGGRAVRERLQIFAGHVLSFREHKARRSFGTKAGLRGTTRVPLSYREGRSVEALSGFTRIGFSLMPIGSGANSRVVGATGFHPLPVSLFAPRVAVLLSVVAVMTCLSAGSTSL